MRLFNTLSRRKEEFVPRLPGQVSMYTCGPTVYRDVHLGNLRSYLMADWLRRALSESGLAVEQVKNITDVGHMRQELVEQGEDKVVAAALAAGQTPAQIAEHYTDLFFADERRLGILPAKVFPRATAHVPEMIAITRTLVEKGYAYVAGGNVYFDVTRYPDYGRLSGNQLPRLLEGVRVETDPLKRHQTDFALWKAAEPGRVLSWPSPWGDGFPGWHIECSAMATRYLGTQLDLHTGGVDNIFPHHEDEIAQSECAFGVPFARYWVHGQHLLADGLKMAKSTGNSYTLAALEQRGFDPLAFRYLCLTAHYRSRLNFTFAALRAAQRGLDRLRELVRIWREEEGPRVEPAAALPWRQRFWEAVDDDLALPRALATVWALTRSELPPPARLALVLEFDRVLGLDLQTATTSEHLAAGVVDVARRRAALRASAAFAPADDLRRQIGAAGYQVRDLRPLPSLDFVLRRQVGPPAHHQVSSAREVPSWLELPDAADFSVQILAHGHLGDLQRCVGSVLRWAGSHQVEVVVVDCGSGGDTADWLDHEAVREPRLRVLHADHDLGEGEGRNLGLRQSRGRIVILLDTSVEVTGDVFGPVADALGDDATGLVGRWGVDGQEDLFHFHEYEGAVPAEVDAIEGYFLAFRRPALREVGWMDVRFRFYRNLDLDFSFGFRARGYHARVLPSLPLERHEHRVWTSLSDAEREKRSKQNFRRFLKKWRGRGDLLVRAGSDPSQRSGPEGRGA